jgi:hypothetical protein
MTLTRLSPILWVLAIGLLCALALWRWPLPGQQANLKRAAIPLDSSKPSPRITDSATPTPATPASTTESTPIQPQPLNPQHERAQLQQQAQQTITKADAVLAKLDPATPTTTPQLTPQRQAQIDHLQRQLQQRQTQHAQRQQLQQQQQDSWARYRTQDPTP